MLRVDVVGDQAAAERMETLPAAVRRALHAKIGLLTLKLYRHIVLNKLSGQVLKTVSGRLKRSVQFKMEEDSASRMVSEVYTDGSAPYDAIHEYGGKTPPHEIVPVKAQALSFLRDGKRVFYKRVNHPGSRMPERSYMRSSLDDMRSEIEDELVAAFESALRGSS